MMLPSRQRGFVLAATLWILAIITIGAAYFAERVERSLALAGQSRLVSQASIDFSSTRAEILFRLNTSGFSVYGLGTTPETAIALDNRPYRGVGQGSVRLQDNRGLLNINFPEREMMLRLLGYLGVAAEKRDALIDTLLDYMDADNLRRLNGAEADEYARLNLPPPPNDWLTTPHQLQNIIGWRNESAFWQDQRLLRLVTTSRVLGFNPNTAPSDILALLPGSNPEIARRILELRRLAPFSAAGQIVALTGNPALDSDYLIFFPSNSIRLTQESAQLPWAVQYGIFLTPNGNNGPWRVDYFARTTVTSPIQHGDEISPLPKRVALPAAAAEAL